MGLLSKFNMLMNHPAIAREEADRRLVARRSTRFAADLASAPAARSHPPEDDRDQRPSDTSTSLHPTRVANMILRLTGRRDWNPFCPIQGALYRPSV
jgi:hypothetical protein